VRKSAVLKLVLGRASVLVAIGLIVGVVGATGAARVLQSVVFGLTALEPATLAGVVALFAVVALVAAYVLARRATRVDPVVALRGE
jgi:putative ABC transport system permease protein